MAFCENKLFIECKCYEKKEYFMEILNSDNILFFQSFITPGEYETKLDAYGTESDVYTDKIDLHIEGTLVYCTLYTLETPCGAFCKRLASKYSVNVQLVYFNIERNFSGKLCLYSHQVVLDEKWTYFQGLYFNDREYFWDHVGESFELFERFDDLQNEIKCMEPTDYKRLREEYTVHTFERFKIN